MVDLNFQKKLENSSGLKLKLKINDNHSTMLSVRWARGSARVSLHRMFLEAPRNVMQSLACYLRKEHAEIAPNVRYFIEENLKKLDYSHLLNRKKLFTQGSVYNLKRLYDEINWEYFNSRLNLAITWFGKPKAEPPNRITLGLYCDPLKLIKIHRLMDSPVLPDYVIGYVIYHEMLHYVCPSYHDENGIHRIHSKEFKKKEVRYEHYDLAQNWIREHYGPVFDD